MKACVDAILIFGIPYYVSKEPGDVWGSEAYGGKQGRRITRKEGYMRENKRKENRRCRKR